MAKIVEANLSEEYERKRDNMVDYGIKGSEKPEQTKQVIKNFMVENIKLEKDWVDKVLLKSTTRLPSNSGGPAPIKICFFYSEDRDECLREGTKLKGTYGNQD